MEGQNKHAQMTSSRSCSKANSLLSLIFVFLFWAFLGFFFLFVFFLGFFEGFLGFFNECKTVKAIMRIPDYM